MYTVMNYHVSVYVLSYRVCVCVCVFIPLYTLYSVHLISVISYDEACLFYYRQVSVYVTHGSWKPDA